MPQPRPRELRGCRNTGDRRQLVYINISTRIIPVPREATGDSSVFFFLIATASSDLPSFSEQVVRDLCTGTWYVYDFCSVQSYLGQVLYFVYFKPTASASGPGCLLCTATTGTLHLASMLRRFCVPWFQCPEEGAVSGGVCLPQDQEWPRQNSTVFRVLQEECHPRGHREWRGTITIGRLGKAATWRCCHVALGSIGLCVVL